MSTPIPGTGLAVVTDRLWSLQLFYQLLNGYVEESSHRDGVWKNQQLTFSPVDDTPLAAITYSNGKQVSKYPSHIAGTQPDRCTGRFACTTLTPTTSSKSFATPMASGIRARSTNLAPGLPPLLVWPPLHSVMTCTVLAKRAFTFVFTIKVISVFPSPNTTHLLNHPTDATTNKVEELANDGSWYKGKLEITDALGATALAAVAYWFQNQTQIRVYYQDRGLSLREYGYNNSGWFKGRSAITSESHQSNFNRNSSKARSTLVKPRPTLLSLLSPSAKCSFKSTGVISKARSFLAKTQDPGALPSLSKTSALATTWPSLSGIMGTALGYTTSCFREPWLNTAATTVARPGSQVNSISRAHKLDLCDKNSTVTLA